MAKSFPTCATRHFDTPGRANILWLNYRVTSEVLSVARAFAVKPLTDRDATMDGLPQSIGRRGAFPALPCYESDRQEYNCIVGRIRDDQGQSQALDDIAIDQLVMTYREPSRFTRIKGSVRQNLDQTDSQKVAG